VSNCTCVRCGECRGTGQVEYRTGGYPEWELESCSECRGSGITEMCDECQWAIDEAAEEAEMRGE
jgi:DnaJ-class molecular chaperone